jgi:hypothetical protein
MAVMDAEILTTVVASNPEALLGAAASSLADDHRRLIVDSLLQQASAGRRLELGTIWHVPQIEARQPRRSVGSLFT